MNTPIPSPSPNTHGLYSLDVEADGPCPGLYSMLSFGLVSLADPSRSFYVEMRPITDRFILGAMASCNFIREQAMALPPAEEGMAKFKEWLDAQPSSDRRVIWSDNPAFDWQFFNYYCHAFLGTNPFGHSARRIGDYFAGTQHDPRKSSNWKKMRTVRHTHNALDDAMGNAGALVKILARSRPR